ncbi:hypothetical protein [Planobispora rosea]|nr:hypothetical protein [Planobispora rosea]
MKDTEFDRSQIPDADLPGDPREYYSDEQEGRPPGGSFPDELQNPAEHASGLGAAMPEPAYARPGEETGRETEGRTDGSSE